MTKKELDKKLKEAAAFLRKNKKAAIAAGIGSIILAPVTGALGMAGSLAVAVGAAATVAATAKTKKPAKKTVKKIAAKKPAKKTAKKVAKKAK